MPVIGTITEMRRDGGFNVRDEGYRSHLQALIRNTTGAAVTILAGTVMARRDFGTLTAAKISGTGDGVVTAPTIGSKSQVGTYVLACIAAAANAGTFSVFAPDGTRLPDLTVGVAYSNAHLTGLTVADGATDWTVGAIVNAVVPAGDLTWVPFTNATGAPARGILWGSTDVLATATARAVIVDRSAEVNLAELVWDASLSGGALTAATAAAALTLSDRGILFR